MHWLYKIFKFLDTLIGVLFCLWVLGYFCFAFYVERMPEGKIKNVQKPASIVVLTGGSNRINTALNLLSRNNIDQIFISGVNPDVTLSDLLRLWDGYEQEETAPCCIKLGYKAQDTAGNALEVSNWTKQNNIKTFYLMTAAYHMPRARVTFNHVLPDTEIIPYPVISSAERFDIWWYAKLLFSEYNKTLYSTVRNLIQ